MKTIPISGVIGWDVQASDIRQALKDANGEDVTFEINSPGGYVGQGLEIFNLIRNYSGGTTAKLSGYAMSMAAYIPQACDTVMAEDNAVYMVHNASSGVWGDHNEILKHGEYVKGLSGISTREFAKQTAKRGKAKSIEELTKMMDDTSYLFGQDMVDMGFVDSLITTEGGTEKQTALVTAQSAFTECNVRMEADHVRMKADRQLASALMCAMTKTVGAAGTMDTGKDARSLLNNMGYPSQVREMARKVLAGELPQQSLDTLVMSVDMFRETQTNAAPLMVTTEADLQAAIQLAKNGTVISQQQIDAADALNVTTEADLQAAIQLAKEGY